jgi:hypothetical protein
LELSNNNINNLHIPRLFRVRKTINPAYLSTSRMPHNPFKSHEDPVGFSNPKEQSLATILSTPEQRSDLTLLVAGCTSAMRKSITDIFDPRYSGAPSDSKFDDPLAIKDLDLSKVDVKELDKQREEAEDRIKELSGEEMQELKSAALKFFDEWKDGVLGRIGDVVNSKEEAKEQGKELEGVKPEQKQPDPADQKLKEEDINIKEQKVTPNEEVNKAIRAIYPPIKTKLLDLQEDKRRLILHSTMLLLLSLEHYLSHSRVLLLYLTSSLNIPVEFLTEDESAVAKTLLKAAEEMNADKEKEKKAEEGSSGRKWKVGLAAVAGAAIIGVTGGLAAPLVAAGLGTMMGGLGLAGTAAAGYLGAVAESTLIVGGLFGAYGGRMTGKMMDEYAKEVEDFAFVPIHKFSRARKSENEYRRLRVAICISGWLTEKEEVIKPWRVIAPTIEGFALKYEIEALLKLGNAMSIMLQSKMWLYAKKEIIKRTIFAALQEALWPLALLKVSRIVDNPFSVALVRSDKAGEVLADAIINKAQGERPVTLVGYSLGARVIYRCLMTLAEKKAFGLVENVVMLGTPAPSDSADWRKIRSVVSGRVINVYSENDYVLAFLYRTSSIQFGVAGLHKAEFVKGVENIDVSDIVSGHLRYRYLTGAILKRIGFEDIDIEEVEQEEEELAAIEEAEKDEQEEREKKKGKTALTDDQEAEKLEKEVAKKNEQSMMDWATAKLHVGHQQASALFSGWGKDKASEPAKNVTTIDVKPAEK